MKRVAKRGAKPLLTVAALCSAAVATLPIFLNANPGDREAAEESHAKWMAWLIEKEVHLRYDPARGPVEAFVRHYAGCAARYHAVGKVKDRARQAKAAARVVPCHARTFVDSIANAELVRYARDAALNLSPSKSNVLASFIDSNGCHRTAARRLGIDPHNFRARFSWARFALARSLPNITGDIVPTPCRVPVAATTKESDMAKVNKRSSKPIRTVEDDDEEESPKGGTATLLDEDDETGAATETRDADDEFEVDDDEAETSDKTDDEEQPEDEPAPAKKPAKGGKASAKPAKPEPKAPAKSEPESGEIGGDEEEGYEPDETGQVGLVPLDEIKMPKKLKRPVDEEWVATLARSIKSCGQIYPIVLGTDNVIVAGVHRFHALQKLGRKVASCRFVADAKGNHLKSTDADSIIATGVENLLRKDPTPLEIGNYFKGLVDGGLCENVGDIAKRTGLDKPMISRHLSLVELGTKKLHTALAEGQITLSAANSLLARAKKPDEIDAALGSLMDAASGKISRSDVEAKVAKPTRNEAGKKSRGAKVRKTALGSEALATDDTGISGKLYRVGASKKVFKVLLEVEIDVETETFSRFDLNKAIQRAAGKFDPKKVAAELELARQRLLDS